MRLHEKYFLVVCGSFEKGTLEYDEHPTEEEIKKAIKKFQGKSARIEKRYVLKERVSI